MFGGQLKLKIKIKSLAEEARIIREAELKLKEAKIRARKKGRDPEDVICLRLDLSSHRRGPLRSAARDNLLAYACIRDVPYSTAEVFSTDEPNWYTISELAKRFAYSPEGLHQSTLAKVEAWIAAAKLHFSSAEKSRKPCTRESNRSDDAHQTQPV